MKRQWISLCTVVALAGVAAFQLANTGGPSVEATGSTFDSGQNACTQCHTSFALNSGSGSIALTGATSYYPGSTYTLTMTVSQSTPVSTKFGFQTIGLTAGNAQAGTFTTGTGTKLQTIGGRQYIEHNTGSTSGTWTFDWTADANSTGDVTFYFGGNASNSNSSTSGDQIYSGTQVLTQIPLITASTSSTDPSCNGLCDGSATVSGTTGGVPPYTYAWNDPSSQTATTATNLCAGTYVVTITDNGGNTETETVTLTDPPALVLTTTTTDATCGLTDGSATAQFTGGTLPITYLWNDPSSQTTATASSLGAGTYNVIATDGSGCTASATAIVLQGGSGITGNVAIVNAACNLSNGSATMTPAGGVAPYTYQWNDAANQTTQTAINLPFGTYNVTVTDNNGCSEVFTGSVQNDDAPVIIGVVVNVTCFGGSDGAVQVDILGGTAPYTFSWTDAMNNVVATTVELSAAPAGTYVLEVTDDGGCSVQETFVVEEPDEMTVAPAIDADINSQCNGEITLNVSGGATPYTYEWSDPANQTTEVASNLCAGLYSVTVTDGLSCEAVFEDIEVPSMFSSVDELEGLKLGFSMWPNPSEGMVQFKWEQSVKENTIIELLDLTGRQVAMKLVPAGSLEFTWSLDDQPAGLYLIREQNSSAKAQRLILR